MAQRAESCMEWARTTSVWLKLSAAFSAGAIGGLCNALMALTLYATGIQHALHVHWDPIPYHTVWLYNKLVWGGFWGSLHVLPWKRAHWLVRGVCYGLLASTVHSFIVFPAQQGGVAGSGYGRLTVVVVYVTDACWAVGSACWYRFVVGQWEQSRRDCRREDTGVSLHSSSSTPSSAAEVLGLLASKGPRDVAPKGSPGMHGGLRDGLEHGLLEAR